MSPRAAESLQKWRPGEVMYLDKRGNVASPTKVRWLGVAAWSKVGLIAGTYGVLTGILLQSPVAGAVALSAIGALVAVRMRHSGTLRQALVLIANDRREDARVLLMRLDGKRLHRYTRFFVDRGLGAIAWADGRFDEALARLGRAVESMADVRHPVRQLVSLAAVHRVECLAAAGRVDEARAARAALAPEAGELYQMTLREADLAIAFHAGDPAALPDDETLYEWSKAVLATNRFGPSAILLAWAFQHRGDADMARHMLDEAPARMFGWTIEKSMPKLQAWAEQQSRVS